MKAVRRARISGGRTEGKRPSRELVGLAAFWPELDEAAEQVVTMRRLAAASPGLAAVKKMSYVL